MKSIVKAAMTEALLNEIPFGRWMSRQEVNSTPAAADMSPHSLGLRLSWLAREGKIAVQHNKAAGGFEYQRKAK